MPFTVTIDITNMDEFKTGFLKAVRKPEQYIHLTDLQFFKQWLEDSMFNAYKTGKLMIAQETTTPDITNDIVSVS